MVVRFDRDDLIAGLRELVERAQRAGLTGVSIQIVGGAALRLAYFERATTVDIDARLSPEDQLSAIIHDIAAERAWPEKWINSDAEQFIPRWGRDVHWRTVWLDDQVSVSVASADALLAMKLHAVQHRGNRDIGDVAKLLAIVGVGSVVEAQRLYGEFYPGDEFTPRTYERLERVFGVGLPAPEPAPAAPFDDVVR